MASSSDKKLQGLASSGVEALIDRLREEGVASGRREADALIAAAEQRAAKIVADAEARAAQILKTATEQGAAERHAGEEALRIAMRDTVLRLKSELTDRFSDEVKRLIAAELEQEAFVERLILEVAGRAREEAGIDAGNRVQVILPRDLIGLDELRRNPLELREGSLSHFVLSLAGNVLAEGVSFSVGDDDAHGIRLYLQDQDVHIDLTDEKIAQLLLQHLQPRFRAILEGTVK
jgi:V/A-type H+-transporting ATPase subunit E